MFSCTAFVFFICSSTLVLGQPRKAEINRQDEDLEARIWSKMESVLEDMRQQGNYIQEDLNSQISGVRQEIEQQSSYIWDEIIAL